MLSWANLPSAVNSRVISALFNLSSLVVKSKYKDKVTIDIIYLYIILYSMVDGNDNILKFSETDIIS